MQDNALGCGGTGAGDFLIHALGHNLGIKKCKHRLSICPNCSQAPALWKCLPRLFPSTWCVWPQSVCTKAYRNLPCPCPTCTGPSQLGGHRIHTPQPGCLVP